MNFNIDIKKDKLNNKIKPKYYKDLMDISGEYDNDVG